MDTYAIQMMLFFQDDSSDDDRFEAFLDEVKRLAEQNEIEFGEYQSMRLPGRQYNIAHCNKCGYLTVNKDDVDSEAEDILPDFWFYAHKGVVSNGVALCDECKSTMPST